MYWLQYIRYFFYLAWHWNLRLAFFVTKHEIEGENDYRIHTTGIDHLTTSLTSDELKHASIYQPVNFYTAEKLFDQLDINDYNNAFMDVGCGKGRVIAMAAAKGFKEIFALDLSPAMCAVANSLADVLEERYHSLSIAIDCADAATFEVPHNTGVIFMFNPFDEAVMQPFVRRVKDSLRRFPRKMKVLYANPVHARLWKKAGFEETYHFTKMKYLEGMVLEYKPAQPSHKKGQDF